MRLILAIIAASLLFSSARAQAPVANEREIPTDGNFAIKLNWFDGAACPDRDKTRFYFRIGKQAFVTPVSDLIGGQLRYIKSGTPVPGGGMKASVSRTSGCKSDPLLLVTAALRTGATKPDIVQITETPEQSESEALVTRYIKHLSQTGACKATRFPDVVACGGSRTAGGKKVDIAFFVVTDGDNKISLATTGIPIHARCEGDAQTLACFVSDDTGNGATVKSLIDLKGMTGVAEEIRRFRQTMLDFAAKRRAQ
jgi:hypothetical protein